MTALVTMPDVEALAKAWALSIFGVGKVFLSIPENAPVPVVLMSRVGGGIVPTSDVPVDSARISFQCWGRSRTQAGALAQKLVSEAASLADAGGFTSTEFGGRLLAAEVPLHVWMPDPSSDIPRYVVDVRFTVTPL
jgi:hypothetical protein